ncbi:hypothetical protein ABT352_06650 [Streptosporangium sp. NPDC000563]|uniref:hypothetical protein n=1 Tax=Streptosporangium sp. NPDC000563 TaxID=3154366 RepID=UPI003330B304
MADETLYLRFQGTARDRQGRLPGVFGLVNSLASGGKLTAEQERFRRTNNDWYDANFTNPSDVDPTVYDHTLNPGAAAWFKSSAHPLIERVAGYMEILAAHGVDCEAVYSSDPGKIIYEDDHQIVVIPHMNDVTASRVT